MKALQCFTAETDPGTVICPPAKNLAVTWSPNEALIKTVWQITASKKKNHLICFESLTGQRVSMTAGFMLFHFMFHILQDKLLLKFEISLLGNSPTRSNASYIQYRFIFWAKMVFSVDPFENWDKMRDYKGAEDFSGPELATWEEVIDQESEGKRSTPFTSAARGYRWTMTEVMIFPLYTTTCCHLTHNHTWWDLSLLHLLMSSAWTFESRLFVTYFPREFLFRFNLYEYWFLNW